MYDDGAQTEWTSGQLRELPRQQNYSHKRALSCMKATFSTAAVPPLPHTIVMVKSTIQMVIGCMILRCVASSLRCRIMSSSPNLAHYHLELTTSPQCLYIYYIFAIAQSNVKATFPMPPLLLSPLVINISTLVPLRITYFTSTPPMQW